MVLCARRKENREEVGIGFAVRLVFLGSFSLRSSRYGRLHLHLLGVCACVSFECVRRLQLTIQEKTWFICPHLRHRAVSPDYKPRDEQNLPDSLFRGHTRQHATSRPKVAPLSESSHPCAMTPITVRGNDLNDS